MLDLTEMPNWFLEDAITDTLPGLTNYVRDVNLPAEVASLYKPGTIIRELGFTDASARVMGMVTTHRFSILSNHMADFGEMSGDEKALGWGLNVAQAGSRFQVLDVYEKGGKTQILLLHLPEGERWRLFDHVQLNVVNDMIPGCRERFEAKKDLDPIPELDEEWLERCKFPLGVDDDGKPFALECSVESRLKPISEYNFRELDKRELFIRGVRKALHLEESGCGGSEQYPDALAYGYVDHEKGLCFQYLCEARLTESGEIETSDALDGTLIRIEAGAVMDKPAAEVVTGEMATYADVLTITRELHEEEIGKYSDLRKITFLDQFRAKEWPDDIQAMLLSERDLQPEMVWMRLEALAEDGLILANLLNEPNQDFGVHEGDQLPIGFHEVDSGIVCFALAEGEKE